MTYGIEVLDANNKTIFNSSNPTELVVWSDCVLGNTHIDIPDYCYGWDTTVAGSTTTATNTAGIPFVIGAGVNFSAWSNVYQMIFPFNALADYTGGVLSLNTGDVFFDHTEYERYPIVYGVVNGNYTNAYVVWKMNKDVSAIRGTAASRSITLNTTHQVFPSLYARPVSPGTTPVVFALVDTKPTAPSSSSRYNRGVTIADRNGGTSNTFEVVVAIPSKDWGGVSASRTSKYTSGSADHGLEAYTDSIYQHHSASTVGQFVTYSTRSRPTKFSASAPIYVKAVDQLTASNMTPFPILTAATTPYNRYCRMNPTRHYVQSSSAQYTYQYDWRSNYDIRLHWNTIAGSAGAIFTADTYTSQLLYGIVDFGAGL